MGGYIRRAKIRAGANGGRGMKKNRSLLFILIIGFIVSSYNACSKFQTLNTEVAETSNSLGSSLDNSQTQTPSSPQPVPDQSPNPSPNPNPLPGPVPQPMPSPVPPVSNGGAWPNEPGNFSPIFDWNFNASSGNGLVDVYKSGRIVNDPSAPFSPGNVLELRKPAGATLGGGQFDYYFAGRNEVYVGMWWKTNAEFDGYSHQGNKLFFVISNDSNSVFYWYGPSGGEKQLIFVFQAGAGTALNNCHIPQFQGACGGADGATGLLFPNVGDSTAIRGQWHRIELQLRRSTTATSRDGIIRWWLDGRRVGDFTNVNLGPNPFYWYSLNQAWDGTGAGYAHDWVHWFDHLRISGK